MTKSEKAGKPTSYVNHSKRIKLEELTVLLLIRTLEFDMINMNLVEYISISDDPEDEVQIHAWRLIVKLLFFLAQ